jgi:hypothetical protein
MSEYLKVYLKILKLYSDLLVKYKLKQIDEYEIQQFYVEYLKLLSQIGTNQPVYKENTHNAQLCNSYCYALDFNCPKIFDDIYKNVKFESFEHYIGFLSYNNYTTNCEQVIRNLYEDLECLNIQFYNSNIEKQVKHGGYKIALFNWKGNYQLTRQNVDGTWSEKIGYDNKVYKLKDPYHTSLGTSYHLEKVIEIVKPIVKIKK